jgi:hypothetical protein
MSELNDFQIQVLENVQAANEKEPRSARVMMASPGYYHLSFDKFATSKIVPQKGEASLFAIYDLVENGLLKKVRITQPAPGGSVGIEFLHITELGSQKLITLRLEQNLTTV